MRDKTIKTETFVLPLKLSKYLNTMSNELGKKKTTIISEALEMYMDAQDLKEARKRFNDPNSKTLSAKEFWNELEKEL